VFGNDGTQEHRHPENETGHAAEVPSTDPTDGENQQSYMSVSIVRILQLPISAVANGTAAMESTILIRKQRAIQELCALKAVTFVIFVVC
jgi:hypothetical protein